MLPPCSLVVAASALPGPTLLVVSSVFLSSLYPGCLSDPPARPPARLPAPGSAWHRALGIGPAPPPLPIPSFFFSYCHAWSVPGPPPSEAFLNNYFFSTSPRCRGKEAGWGGKTRSVMILWKRQRGWHVRTSFMCHFQLGKPTGKGASFGRVLLLRCQPPETLAGVSRITHF